MGALHWRERSRLLSLGCVMLSRYLLRLSDLEGAHYCGKYPIIANNRSSSKIHRTKPRGVGRSIQICFWPSDSNKNKSGKRSKRGLGWGVDNIKTNPENGHNCHWAATGWSAHGKRLGERFGSLFALFAPPTPRYHLDLEFST